MWQLALGGHLPAGTTFRSATARRAHCIPPHAGPRATVQCRLATLKAALFGASTSRSPSRPAPGPSAARRPSPASLPAPRRQQHHHQTHHEDHQVDPPPASGSGTRPGPGPRTTWRRAGQNRHRPGQSQRARADQPASRPAIGTASSLPNAQNGGLALSWCPGRSRSRGERALLRGGPLCLRDQASDAGRIKGSWASKTC